jgi:hypothetical protein
VDAEDYEWLSQYKWSITTNKRSATRYARTAIGPRTNNVQLKMHRVIMNAQPGQVVDHINGNGLDNRKCNLRVCTQSQNMANMQKHRRGSSQFKGVIWKKQYKKKWEAAIHLGKKRVVLGRFDDEAAAARAYDAAARQHFGEFARLNFPDEVLDAGVA